MTSPAISYDVLVIGGGTAGSAAARAARQAGARVAMFNDGELGGLCILRGCMPTKTLLHAAHLVHHATHSHTPGVAVRGAGIDFAAVMANKDAKVARFQRAKVASIESGGYDVIDARARFTGPDTISAAGVTYRFTSGAVLAAGSVPAVPPIRGIDDVPFVTSDDLMWLAGRPDSVVAVGAGAVGLELCQFLARMGTRVTLLSRHRVFERIDPVLAGEMERILAAEPNFELLQPVRPVRVSREAGQVACELDDGRRIVADLLFLATGRTAVHSDLDLPAAGIRVQEGVVICGDDMQTTNPRVFVAGDATGEEMILHVASQEGRVAGSNAAAGGPVERVDRRVDIRVIFTDPPLGTLGMTEQEATRAGRRVITSQIMFPETGRAITQDVQHGLCKVVADAARGEIIGAQILGPRADDLIHTLAAVLFYRGTAADMLSMPWYHPTQSEVFLSLAREIELRRRTIPPPG